MRRKTLNRVVVSAIAAVAALSVLVVAEPANASVRWADGTDTYVTYKCTGWPTKEVDITIWSQHLMYNPNPPHELTYLVMWVSDVYGSRWVQGLGPDWKPIQTNYMASAFEAFFAGNSMTRTFVVQYARKIFGVWRYFREVSPINC
jgi:hypothetical protein